MISTVLFGAIAALAFHKIKGTSSSIQQFVLWLLIGLCFTALGVIAWEGGRPKVDAEGTRERIIENLTIEE